MTLELKAIELDLDNYKSKTFTIEASGVLEAGVILHTEHETWNYPPLHKRNIVVLGKGPLTGLGLFGSHRLTFVFRSPISHGLHASSMGGAGYWLMRTGLDLIIVSGFSTSPCLVFIEYLKSKGLEVYYHCIEDSELWRIYNNYEGLKGTRGLHRYIAKIILKDKNLRNYRMLLVGPSSWKTIIGGVFSWVDNGKGYPSPVQDSASRGGAGSVLAQAHGLAGIIVGGDLEVVNKEKAESAKRTAERILGKKLTSAIMESTSKYRYDPKLGTGGTFGVNYYVYRELVPALAYNTIYMSRTVRLHVHKQIMKYFWKPFQQKVFEAMKKPWFTCGEPCSVACKKVVDNVKLDYEPAHAMGPMIGVIELESSMKLVENTDDYGIDAIEAGHIIAWLFDSMEKGLLEPRELGLKNNPSLDPLTLSPETSRINYMIAEKILDSIVETNGEIYALIGRHGARYAAKILDELYDSIVKRRGYSFKDLLVYAAFGTSGYMTPNYYWSPGMIAPLFVLGRYWTNYSPTYNDPEHYAESSVSRAINEMIIDNAGICRFHRKWISKVIDALYSEVLGADVDLEQRMMETYKLIAGYNIRADAEPVPWESLKTMDIVATIASEIGVKEWEGKVGDREVLLEWWNRFYTRVKEIIGL